MIAQLHEHERVELVDRKAWNGILHALVDSIAGGTTEDIGQQLLIQCELVRKFHCEGFQPEEPRESKDGPSAMQLCASFPLPS